MPTSHYTCDVHKTALMQSKVLRFVSGHVPGLISGALALGETGSALAAPKSGSCAGRETVCDVWAAASR